MVYLPCLTVIVPEVLLGRVKLTHNMAPEPGFYIEVGGKKLAVTMDHEKGAGKLILQRC